MICPKECLCLLANASTLHYNRRERKVVFVANTSAVYARINTELKDNAEGILNHLGITPSSAIQMLYSQIVIHKGLPFDLRLPVSRPVAIGNMTRDELDMELAKGIASLKNGETLTPDEFDKSLAEEFGI